ncbi:MAG: hypothetical protein MUC69_07815 [Gemmatimonadales bacterium]|jgi:hypothetical protein|nr:hypothetical protein [Gemmatimonadales bacterium]
MGDVLPVRVLVQDTWDEVRLAVPSSTPVGVLKATALRQAGVVEGAEGFVAKFRGALLDDEDRSLAEVGMVPNVAVIVMPRRRRPVR